MRTPPQLVPSRAPRWSWWLVAIMMVGSGIPLLIAGLSGNLTIPHDDGWAYSKITEVFARTGEIHLLGWNRTSLIGQVVMLGPFGRSLIVQQVAVAVLAALALYCVYYLVGQTLTRNRALLATLLVALWPGYASLATSFMSDIPALLGTLGSLALGAAALRRDSRQLLWLCILVGAWATTVREQSLLAPVTVLAYGWATHNQRHNITRRDIITTSATLAASMFAFLLWRQSLPRGDHAKLDLAPHAVLTALWQDPIVAWFTLALPLTPAVVYSLGDHRPSRPAIYFAIAVGSIGLLAHVLDLSPLAGDYMTFQGQTQIGGSSILGSVVPHVILLVVWASGTLMAMTLVDRWRDGDPLLLAFTGATLIMTVLIAIVGQAIVDRYLIVLAPGMLTILLANRCTSTQPSASQGPTPDGYAKRTTIIRWCTVTTLAALALFSGLLTLNHFAYDRAQWNASTALVKAGIPAQRVDGGMAWDGTYSPYGMLREGWMRTYIESVAMESQMPCAIVTRVNLPKLEPVPAAQLVGRVHYKRFLLFGSSRLAIYTFASAPDCPNVDLTQH